MQKSYYQHLNNSVTIRQFRRPPGRKCRGNIKGYKNKSRTNKNVGWDDEILLEMVKVKKSLEYLKVFLRSS